MGTSIPEAETLVKLGEVLEVSIDELLLGRAAASGVQDVQVRQHMRELEKVDRKYRDAAIVVLEAFVVKGRQDAAGIARRFPRR